MDDNIYMNKATQLNLFDTAAMVRETLQDRRFEKSMLQIYFEDPSFLNRLENWALSKSPEHVTAKKIKKVKELLQSMPSLESCSENKPVRMTTLWNRKFSSSSHLLCGHLQCDCHARAPLSTSKIKFAPTHYSPYKPSKSQWNYFMQRYKEVYGFPLKFNEDLYLEIILKKAS